jgi:hypothetical protein
MNKAFLILKQAPSYSAFDAQIKRNQVTNFHCKMEAHVEWGNSQTLYMVGKLYILGWYLSLKPVPVAARSKA